jgi:Domain of unknown function (DUF4403)
MEQKVNLKYNCIQLFVFIYLSFLSGCTPSNQSQIKAPQEIYKYTNVQVQNEKHISAVSIPFEISIADIAQQLNNKVQGLIYEDNSFEDDNRDGFKTKVWKNGPITVDVQDSLLYYVVPLKVWAQKAYQIGPISGEQDTNFEIKIKFVTAIGMNTNWQMETRTASSGFDWVTKPSIKVAGIELPITGLVSRKLTENLPQFAKNIDDNIKQNFEIKKYVVQAWNLLREPRLISEPYRTWLLITPTDATMTPFVIDKNKIKASINIKGYTQTQTGEKPNVVAVKDIPNLSISTSIGTGFQIGLIASLPYAEATRFATAEFVGKTFEFKDGQYKVEVTNIDIYGQNEKLIIKAGLKGSINGNVYLKGLPHYDPTTRALVLKNLDYDLDTRSVLVKTANWLLQGRFVKQLEQQFTLPLGSQMEETQKATNQQLANRQITKGVTLNGKLNTIEPDQVYLTSSSLMAVVFVKGNLEIKVNGLL